MSYYTMADKEKLHIRQVGQGEPVLLLSGLGMSSWQWLPYIYPSLKKRHFIIPDYRGFGGSKYCKIPQDLNAIESHWQDLKSLIRLMNIDKIDVIGYSMGATTTMHGLQHGGFANHIKRYLHIDQTAKIKNDHTWQYGLFGQQQKQFFQIIQKICHLLAPHQQEYQKTSQLPVDIQKQFTALWLQFLNLQKSPSTTQRLVQKLPLHKIHSQFLPTQSIPYIVWYLQTYLAHDEDYRSALTQLKQPTHFIIGKQSTLYDYRGQLFVANQLENAQIHLMPKSGHVPLISEPLKFQQLLNQFLTND